MVWRVTDCWPDPPAPRNVAARHTYFPGHHVSELPQQALCWAHCSNNFRRVCSTDIVGHNPDCEQCALLLIEVHTCGSRDTATEVAGMQSCLRCSVIPRYAMTWQSWLQDDFMCISGSWECTCACILHSLPQHLEVYVSYEAFAKSQAWQLQFLWQSLL